MRCGNFFEKLLPIINRREKEAILIKIECSKWDNSTKCNRSYCLQQKRDNPIYSEIKELQRKKVNWGGFVRKKLVKVHNIRTKA